MKTESLREVKNNLSRVIEDLPRSGPVVITRSGKASAVLLPVSNETDLETLLLSSDHRFWRMFDRATGGTKWTSLPPHRVPRVYVKHSFSWQTIRTSRSASLVRC